MVGFTVAFALRKEAPQYPAGSAEVSGRFFVEPRSVLDRAKQSSSEVHC